MKKDDKITISTELLQNTKKNHKTTILLKTDLGKTKVTFLSDDSYFDLVEYYTNRFQKHDFYRVVFDIIQTMSTIETAVVNSSLTNDYTRIESDSIILKIEVEYDI